MTNDQTREIDIADEDVSEVGQLPDSSKLKEGETIDWQKQAEHFKGIADRRTTKLSKIKESMKTKIETPAPAQGNAPKGLDFGQKAYLASVHDVKHPEDVARIEKAMKDTGGDLESVMKSQYLIGEIRQAQEERTTKAAQPGADGRSDVAGGRDTVEYWIAKGELPPADQVELRRKVVNAKAAKGSNQDPFAVKK